VVQPALVDIEFLLDFRDVFGQRRDLFRQFGDAVVQSLQTDRLLNIGSITSGY